MLRIVTWLAVYTLLVYALGRVVRPWKDRSWFKASFLPGTVLGVLVQKVAAALCLSTRCRCSPLGDRRPAFDVDTARVPVLAGALFVLLSHVLFYVVFLFGVSYLEARGSLNAHVVSLPDIPTYQAMEGYFHLDAREYVEGVRELRRNWSRRPLVLSLTFYVVAGALASLTVSGLQFRWSIIALGTLAGLTYFGDYLEIGFPFLSRGWLGRVLPIPVLVGALLLLRDAGSLRSRPLRRGPLRCLGPDRRGETPGGRRRGASGPPGVS